MILKTQKKSTTLKTKYCSIEKISGNYFMFSIEYKKTCELRKAIIREQT